MFTDPRTSKIYSLEPNFVQNGVRNIVRFFSTWPEEITDNSTIIFEYIQTFGANSNYEKDTFTSYMDLNDMSTNTVKFDDDVFDSSGNNINTWTDVDISFSQPKAFSGGQNFESIDVIRKSYIQSLRETTSLVVLNDYYAFISLRGINEFYVTDWNKNYSDLITIDYPRDIKALKAEEDSEGHSIFSPENTTKDPYWPDDVSYINNEDPITQTRTIKGREIIIFKSFDVDFNDFKQYEGEHWYDEWVNASKIKSTNSSYSSLKQVVYIASPERKQNNLNGNFDNELMFIDTQSRPLLTIGSIFRTQEEDQQENHVRVFVRNDTNHSLCAKPEDFETLSQKGYNSSNVFISKLFKSKYMKEEITSLLLDAPPVQFSETETFQTNIADVMFEDKQSIYTNEFTTSIQEKYGEQYTKIKDNEELVKNILKRKINSITIKIDGIESPINVPSSEWYDTFLIIDGYTERTDNTQYKRAYIQNTGDIYNTVGYGKASHIDAYVLDTNKEDVNGLPILNLYSSEENKENAVVSGNIDYSSPKKLYANIGLCFRKKKIDLLNNLFFGSSKQIDNTNPYYLKYENNDVFYTGQSYQNTYIQKDDCVYIPIFNDIPESDLENVSPYKLRNIVSSFYINKDTTNSSFDNEANAYKAIEKTDNGYIVTISDEFYHDDFVFDINQLTSKPLNLHYYINLFTQKNINELANDNCDIIYVENNVANLYNNYTIVDNPQPGDPEVTVDTQLVEANTQFGFIRTALSCIGNHKYDYKEKQNDAISCITGNESIEDYSLPPIQNIASRISYIKNNFLLDIQTSYPKYLKYLILRVCSVYEAKQTMSHKQLNEMLLQLGFDNIIYGLSKIVNAEYTINYWYSDTTSTIGKQYSFSPNENKRFLCCGGTTSWDEDKSPSKNYFRWNVVYPEIVDLYKDIQQKQGRGDSVYILPYVKTGVDVHAHIFIEESTADVASVFENIWDALISWFGLLKNITEIKYISELISVIQSSDVNILKICTLNETPYSGQYTVQSSKDDSIYIDDVSKSSVKDFYTFLNFYPQTDIQPKTNLGQSIVLGNVCIRLQKKSPIEKTVYHFERSCFKIDTTLAYILRQIN